MLAAGCRDQLVVFSSFSRGEELDIIHIVFLCLFPGVGARRRLGDESGG